MCLCSYGVYVCALASMFICFLQKGMPLFVSASRLLRECQLNRFVIGGLIVHNKKLVLCVCMFVYVYTTTNATVYSIHTRTHAHTHTHTHIIIVLYSRIVCSQLPASIVKKLCMVAQVEYDARHSDLVHDMTKVCP